MVGRQVLRGGLIERDAPVLMRARVQEAPRDLLSRLWRAHWIPQHDGDMVYQPVMDQSCSIGGQEMPVLGSLAKEGQAIASILSHQFRLTSRNLFCEREVSHLIL
jgi:hypothetical protein